MAHRSRIWWRGIYVCSCIKTIVELMMEPRLRAECGWAADRRIKIFQGCYNAGGVGASAGTHDEGGALDTEKLNDKETIVTRECGTTSWQRGSPEDDFFDDHNHLIWIGCPDLSSGAANQVTAYRQGKNGLANGGPDKSPDVPYTTWQSALEKYQATEEEGIFGMGKPVPFDISKEQVFTGDGTWRTVKIDDDGAMSFCSGPKDSYIVTSHWTLATVHGDAGYVQVGDVVQFRFAAVIDYSTDKPTVTKYNYPIKETTMTDGSTFDGQTWLNALGGTSEANATMKLRLFINPPSGKKVKLTKLTSRIMY